MQGGRGYLAIIAVLVMIIAAAMAFRRRRRSAEQDDFMPGDPATPKIREAVAIVSENLSIISQVADSLEGRVLRIEGSGSGADFGEARQILSGARQGMGEVVRSIKRLRGAVETMTPTYQNALGLYLGLRDSDRALWETAKALSLAENRVRELVDSSDAEGPADLKGDLGAAATLLYQMSSCLYNLVRSVHYLGVSLQLE